MVNLRSVEEHVQGIKDGFFQLNFKDTQVIEIKSLTTCINGLSINHLNQFIVNTKKKIVTTKTIRFEPKTSNLVLKSPSLYQS